VLPIAKLFLGIASASESEHDCCMIAMALLYRPHAMRLLQISAPEAHPTAASTQPDAQPALRTGLVAPSGISCVGR
jgi:hypothetical protein